MKREKKKPYKIKEIWIVRGQKEYYETEFNTPRQVKKYIKDWIESWKENAEENEYKMSLAKTDYKTFARVHIVTDENHEIFGMCKDTFNLKVISKHIKKQKIYNLLEKRKEVSAEERVLKNEP